MYMISSEYMHLVELYNYCLVQNYKIIYLYFENVIQSTKQNE